MTTDSVSADGNAHDMALGPGGVVASSRGHGVIDMPATLGACAEDNLVPWMDLLTI